MDAAHTKKMEVELFELRSTFGSLIKGTLEENTLKDFESWLYNAVSKLEQNKWISEVCMENVREEFDIRFQSEHDHSWAHERLICHPENEHRFFKYLIMMEYWENGLESADSEVRNQSPCKIIRACQISLENETCVSTLFKYMKFLKGMFNTVSSQQLENGDFPCTPKYNLFCIPVWKIEEQLNCFQRSYLGLQNEIGTPTELAIRRKIKDIESEIYNSASSTIAQNKIPTFCRVSTGSQREGFRFENSDDDYLYWWTDHVVICHPEQANRYNKHKTTLIMMEYCDDSPGSALLKVINRSECRIVRYSYIKLGNNTYLSSSKYKYSTKDLVVKDSHEHGPCASGILSNGTPYDNAHSLKSDFFPEEAVSWINRCTEKGWPPISVLEYATKTGCHFVPIGRKESSNEEHEWRISFNLIELKCVHSMNHVQFLCYGFFKIFLNDVINPSSHNEKLLCSYFLKTIMFYMIQEKEESFWIPPNFFECFWQCFKFLIHSVYKGNLPNFFIQKNNMFQGKIVGFSKEKLLKELYNLYGKGHECFSQCIEKHKLQLNGFENRSEYLTLCYEIYASLGLYLEFPTHKFLSKYNYNILKLRKTTNLPNFLEKTLIEHICAIRINMCFLCLMAPRSKRIAHSMESWVCLAAKYGFLSNRLFLVMYLYRMSDFKNAISIAEKMFIILHQPHVLYLPGTSANKDLKYSLPSTELFRLVAVNISLTVYIPFLHEIELERNAMQRTICKAFHIPPLVLTLVLLVLCYKKMKNRKCQTSALNELQNLLEKDTEIFVPVHLKYISLQLLGICQQLSEDYTCALDSFRKSLGCIGSRLIEEATHARIRECEKSLSKKENEKNKQENEKRKKYRKK